MSRRISLAPVPAPVLPIVDENGDVLENSGAAAPVVEATPAPEAKPEVTIPAFTAETWYRLTPKGLVVEKRGASKIRYALHTRSPEGESIGAYCLKAGKKGLADMRWGFERGFYEVVAKPAPKAEEAETQVAAE